MAKSLQDIQLGNIRHAKKRAFLAAFRETGNIRRAAEAARCHRESHLHWLKTDWRYAAAFETVKQDAIDLLEAEARRRAIEGTRKPLYYGGQPILDTEGKPVSEMVYSDILLIFLLKGARPEKFRDRYEVSGPSGGPIRVQAIRDQVEQVMQDPELRDMALNLQERILTGAVTAPSDFTIEATGTSTEEPERGRNGQSKPPQ